MAEPSGIDDYRNVATLDDFATYLHVIAESYRHDANELDGRVAAGEKFGERQWTSNSIDEYFDTFENWLRDWTAAHGELQPSWETFALMLRAAAGYE